MKADRPHARRQYPDGIEADAAGIAAAIRRAHLDEAEPDDARGAPGRECAGLDAGICDRNAAEHVGRVRDGIQHGIGTAAIGRRLNEHAARQAKRLAQGGRDLRRRVGKRVNRPRRRRKAIVWAEHVKMRIARAGRQRPAGHARARRRNGFEVGRRHDALPWRPGGKVTKIVSGARPVAPSGNGN